jgi:LysR family glycine cleavage system transcriptional activator
LNHKLPPLQTLRVFEAATRLESFTAAASEFGITQGAVSHHIKALESYIDRSLFLRLPRGAMPTPEARQIAKVVRSSMSDIAGVLGSAGSDSTLTISVLPGFAVKWLFPRLIEFDQQHPEIEVSISTSPRLLDFTTNEADLAIRYGRGSYPGLVVEQLLEEDMFPVCGPQLLEGRHPLRCTQDLAHHVLLHDEIKEIDGIQPGWDSWFRASGAPKPSGITHRRFGQSNMVLQAAIAGMGVALARSPLAMDDLAAGHLVRPFGAAEPSGFAYFLVYPRGAMERKKIRVFRNWLLDQAAPLRPLPEPLH